MFIVELLKRVIV